MALKLEITLRAQLETDIIVKYIAKENTTAAINLYEKFQQAADFLCHNPYAGRLRPEFTDKDLRFWPVYNNYLIVYEIAGEFLRIRRILHTARNIPEQT